ncbi:AaceriADL242Wp [[Ashbya] aceris (nom. inval.)]|nr:AaceriADL242Wp [[Ashbya] aceris (nom. inval.)]
MSFSFGFANAELSDDELLPTPFVADNEGVQERPNTLANPLDAEWLKSTDIPQPAVVPLDKLLESLDDVRLSFEEVQTPQQAIKLFRRELFDVKHQLMSEDNAESDSPDQRAELDILMGETNEDVRKNVYEGGLKSWECSLDLVDFLSSQGPKSWPRVAELGCGTALPSQYIFSQYLRQESHLGLRLLLSDYNESVLRLATLPNLIIAWAKQVLSQEQWAALQQTRDENIAIMEDELQLTQELLSAFRDDLKQKNIELYFISGTWSRSFLDLLKEIGWTPSPELLLLTSETIYQPETLPVIAELLLELISESLRGGYPFKAYTAAKDIYFGVGGSVAEFEQYVSSKTRERSLPLQLTTHKVNAGLKRSIVAIE